MNTKIYKFTILIEYFFAILLFINYYINPFWDDNEKIKIYGIHPNEFYISLSIPIISLLICFILSFIIKIISNSKQIIHNDEKELITKNLRNFNFWRFTFFTNLSFSICFLLYAFFVKLTTNDSMIAYDVNGFISTFSLVYISILILSLVISALLLTTGILWQNNRLPSYITLFIGVLLFSFPFPFVYRYKINCEYINYAFNNSTQNPETNDSNINEDAEVENEEENNEENNSFTFSDLWDDSSEDEANVKQVIKLLIDENLASNGQSNLGEIRTKFNYYITKKFDQSDTIIKRNFNKINDKIQRDPQKIKDAFDNYSYLIYGLVNTKLYVKTNLDDIIEILLSSYYDIQSKDDSNLLLTEIYSVMKEGEEERIDLSDEYYYNLIEAGISEKVKNKYDEIYFGDGNEMSKEDIVWAYSFWARRHKEKNEEVIFEILKEVKNHYSNNDE